MADRMNNTVATLEQQIIERTREVERRSIYLAATAEVGKVANTILDADQLVQQVIELIQKQFDLYYVGLFQISEDGKWAVLRAGTGEVGRNLVARQHRIAAGEGMIGWCIANGQARVAHEVSQEPNRLEIPELPKTQSEAALPLFTRGRIIGALTVQSERIKTFDETMMVALETMADQVAITLDNARLFAEDRNALSTDQKAYAELNQTDWIKTFSERSHYGYYADHEKIEPLDEHNPGLDLAQQDSQHIFHLPIRVRGQVLGTIHARKADTAGAWNPEESALLETLTDQLSIALDNARLYQDTQRRAARDRMVAEISNKMRRAVDMDTLIQTAVREITNAIKVPEAFIQLGAPPVEQDQTENSHEQ
jgi:GAF domain-containing protein